MGIESLINPIFLMGTKWEHRTRKIVANAIEAHDAMDYLACQGLFARSE